MVETKFKYRVVVKTYTKGCGGNTKPRKRKTGKKAIIYIIDGSKQKQINVLSGSTFHSLQQKLRVLYSIPSYIIINKKGSTFF